MKVLHVVGRMNRGGVEVWLMHVFRASSAGSIQHVVGVHSVLPGAFDDELGALGIPIVSLGDPRKSFVYALRLFRLLREGSFDAVHSHTSRFSGVVLAIAVLAGTKVRIAHCHNSYPAVTAVRPFRFMYERLMTWLIALCATHGIAISDAAGEALFEKRYGRDRRFSKVPYGFEFRRYGELSSRASAKESLGFAATDRIVGHVGRFDPVKNHSHIVRLFAELVRREGRHWRLLLVGDGPLRPAVEALAANEGVRDLCVFAGLQTDPAPYFRSMDVFVLPSEREGFAIVALEAQAAGVPVLLSTGVPRDVATIEACEFLALDAGLDAWANAAVRLSAVDVEPTAALRAVEERFGLDQCLDSLRRTYEGVL